MKVWELIEQLQGRDPSGEVVLTLSGDGFNYVAAFDLTPPANRKCIIEADPEDIGVNTTDLKDKITSLENMVDDLQSALQRISQALGEHHEEDGIRDLREAIESTAEVSTRSYPS